ncbi:Iron-sulfur cluster repair protein YtfE [Austwickia sp. TVS 96-490-7B]|uniref:iron-sulfur cluster repair di-iron protein n=1 Tax=Austwickia sp. TVS 96-490-7B TaxID=2830843 RepID=UPI001C58C288|nr:iron-sulfur cluster repair di-iron protein [Austwickia sp. TVS 96-490-7B]MBW3085358.1 Iron-sulfur cluster repair protein YtfE [Austwickia sp. TVS 96-490-7B]
MTLDPTATLGDLVTQDPRRSRILQEYRLDYCCHGERTLETACLEAGIDPAELVDRLDLPHTGETPTWQELDIAQLARHIIDVHHRYLWDEMPSLGELIDLVVGVHSERHPELAQVAADYESLTTDLASHLAKEERILFPSIIALATPGAEPIFPGSLVGPITHMLSEHDVAGDLLRRIRATTGDFAAPDDACPSCRAMLKRLEAMESDVHEHIHKENNVLFPRVLEFERTR